MRTRHDLRGEPTDALCKRDEQGRIIALNLEPGEGLTELSANSPDLLEFMQKMGLEQSTLQQSDMRLVRVLEDLIDLLIERDVIRFTDLPLPAQEKLMERRSIRQSLNALNLLGAPTKRSEANLQPSWLQPHPSASTMPGPVIPLNPSSCKQAASR